MSHIDQNPFNEVLENHKDDSDVSSNNEVHITHEGVSEIVSIQDVFSWVGLIKPQADFGATDLLEGLQAHGVSVVAENHFPTARMLNGEEIIDLCFEMNLLTEEEADVMDPAQIEQKLSVFHIKIVDDTTFDTSVKPVAFNPQKEAPYKGQDFRTKLRREQTFQDKLSSHVQDIRDKCQRFVYKTSPLQRGHILSAPVAAALAVSSPNPALETSPEPAAETFGGAGVTAAVEVAEPAKSVIETPIMGNEMPFEAVEYKKDKDYILAKVVDLYQTEDRFYYKQKFSNKDMLDDRKNVIRKRNRNFSRDGIKSFVRQQDSAGNIIKVVDYDMASEMESRGKLVTLPAETKYYRARQVGVPNHEITSAAAAEKNDDRGLRVRLDTAHVMDLFFDRFHKKLRAAGMREGWDIRPTVPGMLRPVEQRKKVRNSSPDSPHQYGLSFDFSATTYELVHDGHYATFNLSRDRDKHPKIVSILRVADHLLLETLEEMHKEGVLALTTELRPPHYHLTNLTLSQTDVEPHFDF